MTLLPIFLQTSGRKALVVGAGAVAIEKITVLRKSGLEVTVVAPEAHAEVQQMSASGLLTWHKKPFAPDDLQGFFLVIAATNAPEVNASVYHAARAGGIAANSVDDPPNCDFFFGSIVRRGDLQIAISTNGQSPALSQQLRAEIDQQLPEDLGPWLEQMGTLRREVLSTHPRGEERRLLLHRLIQREICEFPDCPTRRMAEPEEAAEAAPDATYAQEENHIYGDLPLSFAPSPEVGVPLGSVSLVGAGPGDPDLLTMRAVHRIQTADVILHDDLVAQAILDLASPSALIQNVGKRCGEKKIHQEQINALMVGYARNGQCVVRLKGGDPMLFGRASEELAALRQAGIPTETVPGITAALAAAHALGVSLTERGGASSVLLTTGHHAQNVEQKSEESAPATRVAYMPGRNMGSIAEEWMADGLSASMPCALVSRASLPDQQIRHSTLGELKKIDPLPAPELLVAGWTLRHS